MFHLRDALVAVREQVGGQPDRALGRVDVVPARDVLLEDVVLGRAAQLLGGHALLLADQLVEQQQHARRRVDRHRGRHLVERDLVKRGPHVVDRVDRHPGPAHLAQAARVIGVQAELGRQVERHRQARSSPCSAGSGSARWTPWRSRSPAYWRIVHSCLRYISRCTPRVKGYSPGSPSALGEVAGQVALVVERLDLDPGVGEVARVVGADDRGDRPVLVGGGHAGAQVTGGRAPPRLPLQHLPQERLGALVPRVAEHVGRACRTRRRPRRP